MLEGVRRGVQKERRKRYKWLAPEKWENSRGLGGWGDEKIRGCEKH